MTAQQIIARTIGSVTPTVHPDELATQIVRQLALCGFLIVEDEIDDTDPSTDEPGWIG